MENTERVFAENSLGKATNLKSRKAPVKVMEKKHRRRDDATAFTHHHPSPRDASYCRAALICKLQLPPNRGELRQTIPK